MPFTIQLAQNESDIAAALRIRHQVFCEEGGYFPPNASSMIVDEFDAFPTSQMFVAKDAASGSVVGTVRATLDGSAGLPSDQLFKFRHHFTASDKLMNVGMFCVLKPYRKPALSTGLLLMCAYFAAMHQVKSAVAPLNPPLAKLIKRFGGTMLSDHPLEMPVTGIKYLPIAMKIDELNEVFLNFTTSNMQYNMIGSYHCMLFGKGETILRKGSRGDSAYVLVDGTAQVVDLENGREIATLKVGDLFGELALLSDDEIRSADVVATSNTRVMVLPKSAFLEHMRNEPEASLALLRVLTTRLRSLL